MLSACAHPLNRLFLNHWTILFCLLWLLSLSERGDLTFMVGGHPRATEAVTPLLKEMGSSVIYCGKHGAGEEGIWGACLASSV